MEPAERLSRLWARVIDYVLILPLLFGASILLPGLKSESAKSIAVIIVVLTAIGYVCLQLYFLTVRGQTIGKGRMGIRIVRVTDDANGGFVSNVLLRGVVPGVLCAIPFLGVLLAIVNILFIFRDDRRCLHDHIAGTRVVKA